MKGDSRQKKTEVMRENKTKVRNGNETNKARLTHEQATLWKGDEWKKKKCQEEDLSMYSKVDMIWTKRDELDLAHGLD